VQTIHEGAYVRSFTVLAQTAELTVNGTRCLSTAGQVIRLWLVFLFQLLLYMCLVLTGIVESAEHWTKQTQDHQAGHCARDGTA